MLHGAMGRQQGGRVALVASGAGSRAVGPTERHRTHPASSGFLPGSARILFLLLLGASISTAARAVPLLEIDPAVVEQGGGVFLEMSGFVPGGYDVTITVDGEDPIDWYMPPGGSGVTFLPIPAGTFPGIHEVAVCAACDQGDLEQRATHYIRVTSGQLQKGEIDYQVEAIEVTQGVRGDIPARGVFDSAILPADAAVHVAGRRTVVRVYPTFDAGEGALETPSVAVELKAFDGGTELGSLYRYQRPTDMLLPLADRRADADKSWNFILPEEWVRTEPGVESRTLSFEARTAGADETPTYNGNNTAYLNDVEFRTVRGKPNAAFWLRPHFIRQRFEQAPGDTIELNADFDLIPMILSNMQDVLPVADGRTGINLRGWRYADWVGSLKDDEGRPIFMQAMVRRFLLTGTLEGNPVHDYHGMFLRAGTCAGSGWLHTPYFHVGVCAQPRYVTAHEITHAIGRAHAGNGHGEADGGGYDASYPGSHGQVEANSYGYNVYEGVAFPPATSTNEETATHDFMSYGFLPQWTSRYTWNAVAAELGSTVQVPTRPDPIPLTELASQRGGADLRMITGFANVGTGEVVVSPFFSALPSGDLSAQGPLQIHVTDEFGQPLRDRSVPLPLLQDDLANDWRFFATQIDMPSSWHRIQFEIAGQEHPFLRSANIPTVTLDEPASGFSWGESGEVLFRWTGFDADGDALTYRIVAQRDGGDYYVLVSDVAEGQYLLDLGDLPGGGGWDVAVEVSDGFQSAFSNVASGTAAPKPPIVAIVHPRNGGLYPVVTPLRGEAAFGDLQFPDGYDPQQQVQWYLNGSYQGEGDGIDLGELPEGVYDLLATFVNDHGLQAESMVTFQVAGVLPGPLLLSPPDGADGVALPALLEWEPAEFVTTYRIQVAADPAFEFVLAEEGGLHDPVYAFDAIEAQTYHWRVRYEAGGSGAEWSVPFSFTTAGAASVDGLPGLPRGLGVQVTPNPFRPDAHVVFRVPEETRVQVRIYDVTGATVRTLFDGFRARGAHQLSWDGYDDRGLAVSTGVYFVEVTADGRKEQVRAVRMK